MAIAYNALSVTVDLASIRANYAYLQGFASQLQPVVKANGYGHGLLPVAQTLAQAGARTLCVGSTAEGVALRSAFGGRILVLLGLQHDEDAELAAGHGLCPVLMAPEQLRWLSAVAQTLGRRLPLALKFDTGMSRLGFAWDETAAVLALLRELPGLEVVQALSHLASSDDPATDSVGRQADRFHETVSALRAGGLEFEACLANSAAILAHPRTHLDAQRPGIALYGGNPFHGTRLAHLGAPLRPAMTVRAPVLAVHTVRAGEGVSYGGTWIAPREARVAVIGAGYADGLSRQLSGRGQVLLHDQRAAYLGRVCMQMTVVDVSHIPQARAGDQAVLLGGEGERAIGPDELADWWGTISYEALCILGLNRRE